MRGEKAFDDVRLSVAKRTELREEGNHAARVVPRRHDIRSAQAVSFSLGLTGEPHERSRGRHLGSDSSDLGAGTVSKNRTEHAEPKIGIRRTLDLLGPVPGDDVPYLMA